MGGGGVEPIHQRLFRASTGQPGGNSETRQLYRSRKAVSLPGGLEQDHHRSVGFRDRLELLCLPFMAPPPMAREPLETPLSALPLKREALWTEVKSLLDKGAISSWRSSEWKTCSILRDLQQGMWMISLDLNDAYLHIPIIPQHRKFLRFALRDHQGILRVYQWGVLPFGLATAPRVFTSF